MSWFVSSFFRSPQDDKFELEAATESKAFDYIDASYKISQIFENFALHRAIYTCIYLRLPDVIGNDKLTIHELAQRIKCENLEALQCLCDTLVQGQIFELAESLYSLGNTGAILQQDIDDSFCKSIRSMMETQNVWDRFGLSLLGSAQEEVVLTDYVKNTYNVSLGHSDEIELIEILDKEQLLDSATIGYLGCTDLTGVISRFSSESEILYLKNREIEEASLDVVVVQRFANLVPISDILTTLKPGGKLILIEKLRRSATDELFSHVCGLPANMALEDWIAMLTEENIVFSYEMTNEKTVVFRIKPHEHV